MFWKRENSENMSWGNKEEFDSWSLSTLRGQNSFQDYVWVKQIPMDRGVW